jgi:hypothetical protein
VRYVGDRVCGKCHQKEYEAYRTHPMGRSCAPVAEASPLEPYDRKEANTFDALGCTFSVERRGRRIFHREVFRVQGKKVAELEEEVHFALGSGTQGRSYLVNRGGFLYQSPISWYAHRESRHHPAHWFSPRRAWDLSPGYAHHLVHFTRGITNECLFCHSHRVAPVAGTLNGYREPVFRPQTAIGCERCHGPGELHVRSRIGGAAPPPGRDRTIVDVKHLEPALREAVCQQCHLQGEARIARRGRERFDYRPGLPLHEFLAVFVRPPELTDGHRAVSHTEQMAISTCFRRSRGTKKLGCLSCHDPHRLPAPGRRLAFYRGRCLNCHREESCSLAPAERRQSQDSCIACHMPRSSSSNIAHSAVTDHRIVRSPDHPPRPRSGFTIPLLPFHAELKSESPRELERDLGLAMIVQARKPNRDGDRRIICANALPFLEAAVDRHPGDVAAGEARGYALWTLGRLAEARQAMEQTLARAPRREVALYDAVRLMITLNQSDAALRYCRRLLEVSPGDDRGHALLAKLLADRGRWPEALRACRTALRLDPSSVGARMVLVAWHLHRGNKKHARAEFELLLAMRPANAAQLRRWFAAQGN